MNRTTKDAIGIVAGCALCAYGVHIDSSVASWCGFIVAFLCC